LKTLLFVVVALAVLVGIAVAFAVARKKASTGSLEGPWPFYAKKPLSQPEQVLYHRLAKALPEHIVLAQVQVSRILGVKKGSNFHEWNNRINRLSYDFVVCSKDSTVLAAIELDEKSHETEDRANTDRKKEKATAAAGVKLIRWHVKSLPDEAIIRAVVVAGT
jgi:very-short-patch-repair endonuclease